MTTPEAAEKFNMLSRGDRVLVALSGGRDSVCLLHLLATNAERLGITVCAAHYNHRLRGEESDRDEAFAGKLCDEMGISFFRGSGDVAAEAEKRHLGIEETAREMRYAFLNAVAKLLGCNKIATAHNADDNAETVLLNLTRRGGTRGLSGIPPVKGNVIRPLLMNTRAEIDAYIAEHGLQYVEDSSNAGDEYTRNVLRHKVMPVLRDINPAFSEAVTRASQNLREDDELLCAMAEEFIEKNVTGSSVSVDAVRALPKPLAVRVFRGICGGALTAKHCEALLGLLEGTELAHADVPDMRVTRDSGRLYFGVETQSLGSYELPINGEVYVSELRCTVKTELIESCGEVFRSFNKFDFNYDGICGNISLTPRREGDRIKLSGQGFTKSLKKLYSEKKLSQSVRRTTPVLRDEKGVIGVCGFGIAERCAAKPGDRVLRIEIKKDSTGEF